MRTKSILLLVIALGCGVVASVAVSQVVFDSKNRAEIETVGILVVAKELSAASKIPPDGFRVEQWPADRVPPGAISDPKLIENKFTKQRFYPGEAIIEAKLSNKGKEFTVPAGFRIFDITVRDESGGGGYIGPGDRVDVFGYFEKGTRINSSQSVKVMENLEVVMIDGVAVLDPEATTQKKASTIQLLVKDRQYVVLDTASNLGKLKLALRPPQQNDGAANTSDDGQQFMDWLGSMESSHSNKSEKEVAEPVYIAPADKTDKPATERPERHEMVIISPSKSATYRWTEGQLLPQKVDPAAEAQAQAQQQANPYAAYPTSYKPSNQVQSAAPVNPANSVQPNMTWDPVSGTWQSGGFKATYPTSK